MNTTFQQFAEAHSLRNGYKLAQTLSPVPPEDDPQRLMAVWRSTNSHSVKGDIKHFIKSSTAHKRKLDHDETTGWVEVYTSYWKAVSEILAGESGKVRNRAYRQSPANSERSLHGRKCTRHGRN